LGVLEGKQPNIESKSKLWKLSNAESYVVQRSSVERERERGHSEAVSTTGPYEVLEETMVLLGRLENEN